MAEESSTIIRDQQAPFNMALETLKSVRKQIDRIATLSMGIVGNMIIDMGEMQHTKFRAVKQLAIISTPLLLEEQSKEIMDKIKNIMLVWGKKGNQRMGAYSVPAFSPVVEEMLDNCVILIQTSLQKKGHFMPSRDESSMF